jgi:hypothetical protein
MTVIVSASPPLVTFYVGTIRDFSGFRTNQELGAFGPTSAIKLESWDCKRNRGFQEPRTLTSMRILPVYCITPNFSEEDLCSQ